MPWILHGILEEKMSVISKLSRGVYPHYIKNPVTAWFRDWNSPAVQWPGSEPTASLPEGDTQPNLNSFLSTDFSDSLDQRYSAGVAARSLIKQDQIPCLIVVVLLLKTHRSSQIPNFGHLKSPFRSLKLGSKILYLGSQVTDKILLNKLNSF